MHLVSVGVRHVCFSLVSARSGEIVVFNLDGGEQRRSFLPRHVYEFLLKKYCKKTVHV